MSGSVKASINVERFQYNMWPRQPSRRNDVFPKHPEKEVTYFASFTFHCTVNTLVRNLSKVLRLCGQIPSTYLPTYLPSTSV